MTAEIELTWPSASMPLTVKSLRGLAVSGSGIAGSNLLLACWQPLKAGLMRQGAPLGECLRDKGNLYTD
jgi:hypothetical protein